MKIIINKTQKIDFLPEHYKWGHQNPPAEYCITQIDSYQCFVKRQKRRFGGWDLLVKAISEEQIPNTPKIISLAKSDDGFYYFFTEKLEGTTLEEALKEDLLSCIDPIKLMKTLRIAFRKINKWGFWYSDLCTKNIFVQQSGEYYLIDIDSSIPHSKNSNYEKTSFEYPPVLIEFARTIGNRPDFDITQIPGEIINQAELVAIAMDSKESFRIPIDKKRQIINKLLYDRLGSEYENLFRKLMDKTSDWHSTGKLIDKLIG